MGPGQEGNGDGGSDRDRPRPARRATRLLLRTTLGDVLRRTRREQRRTLADVARAAKVSMPYLSEVERGRKEASSEVLAAICDALHVELSELLFAAGHDMADGRAAVIRLDAVRGGRRPAPAPRGAGGAECLLAA